LRQLEYFVAVAEEAGFTRAANRVQISQSGVSAQVRRLELELGAALIDRSGRAASLTPAGAAALAPARAALAGAEAVRQAVAEVNGLLRGRIAIGMVTGCSITPLFDAVSAFARAHPGVELGLVEDASDRLADRVRAGHLDAALIGAADDVLPGLESMTIVSEPLVAAVPTGHPLGAPPAPGKAPAATATLADVVAHPLVCMPRGTGVRATLDRACAVRGLLPNVTLEASAPSAVADLAARGLGVAVLAASMVAGHRSLAAVTIADVDDESMLVLVWRPDPPAALRELLARCRVAFGVTG
jgi:DNA-binding transcriptional LysR family regulator